MYVAHPVPEAVEYGDGIAGGGHEMAGIEAERHRRRLERPDDALLGRDLRPELVVEAGLVAALLTLIDELRDDAGGATQPGGFGLGGGACRCDQGDSRPRQQDRLDAFA